MTIICSECAQLLEAGATHCEHCGAATGGPRPGESVVTPAVDVEAQMIEGERLRRELADRKRREQEARRLARQEAVRLEVEARQGAGEQTRTNLVETMVVPEEHAVTEGYGLRSESEALPAEKPKARRKPPTRQSSKKKSQQLEAEAERMRLEAEARERAEVEAAREREAERMRLEAEARERAEAEAAREREAERIRLEAEARERAEAEAAREREAERIRLETEARERAEAEAAREREAERIRLETEARERAEAEAAREREAERIRAESAERERVKEERRRAQTKVARVHPEEKVSPQTVTNVVVKTAPEVPQRSSTNGRGTSFSYSIFNDPAPVPPAHSFSPRMIVVVVVVVGFLLVGLVVGVSKLRTDSQQPITNTQPVTEPANPLAPAGMVYIPGGEFEMGSDQGDEYERPAHSQRIAPFFIDVDEVTCEAYSQFLKERNYQSPAGWKGATYPPGSARKPVTGVTWYDALAYAKWAGKRLPTEAEWEYAARGTNGYRYPWGNDWKAGQANADKAARGLSDVGSFKGNSQFGLRDMSGNAWEWTSSTIHAYPGGKIDESQLPKEPREEVKVLRGGCYLSNAGQATSTYRFAWPARGKYSFEQAGFRCARDAK